jgi:lycopene cyclase domain-containing protein
MTMEKYTYLLLNLGSVLIPLLFSFERRLRFYKEWKALFPALLITAAFFIVWDHYLTVSGVWGFNPKYLIGIWIWDLPLEEWMFFLFIPYSCLFIYGSLNVLLKKDRLSGIARNITAVLIVILSTIAIFNTDKMYTGIKLSLTAGLLVFAYYRNFPWMGKFYRAYLVSLIPFLVVNGLLTCLPVVTYNDAENLGIRIYTIPVEDTQYTLLMLLMNTVLFEHFRKSKSKDADNPSHQELTGLH